VGAMILMGGPVAWATQSPTVETHVSSISTSEALIDPCTGPIGSSTAPLGDCVGTVTEADVVAVQTELWHDIFGTSQEPNISYDMAQDTDFTGRGDYFGVNFYGVPFAIHVYDAVEMFTKTSGPKLLKGSYVFASVVGPTGNRVPVIGMIMSSESRLVVSGPRSGNGPGRSHGFAMVGRMSPKMDRSLRTGEAGDAAGSSGDLSGDQAECAAACKRTKDAAVANANAILRASMHELAALVAIGIAACFAFLKVPGFGILIGGACLLAVLVALLNRVQAAQLIHTGAIGVIMAAYLNCMAACGIEIAEQY